MPFILKPLTLREFYSTFYMQKTRKGKIKRKHVSIVIYTLHSMKLMFDKGVDTRVLTTRCNCELHIQKCIMVFS